LLTKDNESKQMAKLKIQEIAVTQKMALTNGFIVKPSHEVIASIFYQPPQAPNGKFLQPNSLIVSTATETVNWRKRIRENVDGRI
jgi:hypothetical protein